MRGWLEQSESASMRLLLCMCASIRTCVFKTTQVLFSNNQLGQDIILTMAAFLNRVLPIINYED